MSELSKITSDGSGIAFVHADADIRGRAIIFGWGSSGPASDRSVRAFDGQNWTILFPNDPSGLQVRHNGTQLYCPQRDELWVWGGSDVQPGQLRSGVFSLKSNRWTQTDTGLSAFGGIISGGTLPQHPNMACAWAQSLNTGMLFGGSADGIYDDQWMIEPNPGGPEPYRVVQFTGPRPPSRSQAQNLLTAADGVFYLVGGYYNVVDGVWQFRKDFWRFDGAWTRLADPPYDTGAANVLYDSDQKKILFWAWDKLYTWSIDRSIWEDETPAGLPARFNGIGVYLRNAKKSFFEGGDLANGNGDYVAYLITLNGGNMALDLPNRKWISRPYPLNQPDVRNQFIGQHGFGVNGNAGCKHQRLAYNPANQKVYFYSGDFAGAPFNSSFHTDMFSYDITKPDSGDGQSWKCEWPYCGLPNEVAPCHTDEAPFCYDSKRKIFWIMGGFELSSEDAVGMCNNGAIRYGWSAIKQNPDGTPNLESSNAQHGPDLLQFDPAANRYSRPDQKYQMPLNAKLADGIPVIGTGGHTPRHATYNLATDEIIMSGQDGAGNFWVHMNAETGEWKRYETPVDYVTGAYINDASTVHEQLALDVVNQSVYVIDSYRKTDPNLNQRFRLFRYDLAQHGMITLGWIPLPNFGDPLKFPFYMPPFDSTCLMYDSINKVLLWPASSNEGRPILMIYHPDTKSWETDPMIRDKSGEIITGSNGCFIPELNALIIYGGFGTPHSDFFADHPDSVAPHNYFWLYRYGDGGGGGTDVLPPDLAFSVDMIQVQPGQSPTLTWGSTNALTVTASGAWNGQKPLSGSEQVNLTATSTYIIKATGPGGSVARSITVTVVQPPPINPPTTPTGPDGYDYACPEGDSINFEGTKSVAYGAVDKAGKPHFVFKDITSSVSCSNEVFGDPLVGTVKACFVQNPPTEEPDVLVTVKAGIKVQVKIIGQ